MKELYTEGLARHGDPESCGGSRKGSVEAYVPDDCTLRDESLHTPGVRGAEGQEKSKLLADISSCESRAGLTVL